MNKKKTLLLAVLLISLLIPFRQVWAQTQTLTLDIENVAWQDFPTVELRVNLWRSSGTAVKSLEREQIVIREDGGQPIQPNDVIPLKDAPLDVVLVLDVSGSMQGKPLADAKTAAARFLDRLEKNDQAGLIAFSEPVDLAPGALNLKKERQLSADRMPLYDLVEGLQANGGTHLYNAAAKAVGFFDEAASGRRAVLLLSDGRNDPPTVGDPEQVIEMAKTAGVPFFVIGLGEEVDDAYLTRLASETGGLYRKAPKSGELAQMFSDMAELLKTQYVVRYTSGLAADGGQHELEVTINVQGANAGQSINLGPLPLAPTGVPTLPPLVETEVVEKVITTTPLPAVVEEPETPAFPLGLVMAAVIALGLGLWLTLRKRTPKPTPEACARCGRDLTGVSGACPDCGETKRLKKLK
jgi:VWFA-related protein